MAVRERETEGVTKFVLDFRKAPPPDPDIVAPLNAWRTVLHRLGLTAQDPLRYGGVGFGNVSMRTTGHTIDGATPLFLVSGTQTAGLPKLTQRHYCWVMGYDLRANSLHAAGLVPPSSETLTHAAVYRAEPSANCVLHVHSPEIWTHAAALGIPVVDEHIPYGTPEMADAVGMLVDHHAQGIIAMGGHEDGIVAYGSSIETTALDLVRLFARALQLPC